MGSHLFHFLGFSTFISWEPYCHPGGSCCPPGSTLCPPPALRASKPLNHATPPGPPHTHPTPPHPRHPRHPHPLAQGTVLLATSAWIPGLMPPPDLYPTSLQNAALFTSLYIVALGTGGIKPNVSAFGADQFDESDPQVHRLAARRGCRFVFRGDGGGGGQWSGGCSGRLR